MNKCAKCGQDLPLHPAIRFQMSLARPLACVGFVFFCFNAAQGIPFEEMDPIVVWSMLGCGSWWALLKIWIDSGGLKKAPE